MVTLILALSVFGGNDYTPVETYRTGSYQLLYLQPEDPIHATLKEAYSTTGCWCAMCVGNGSSGYTSRTVEVNTPTPLPDLERVLRGVGLTASDILYDLGSGDGRVPILAAKEWGSTGVGVDTRVEAVSLATANARRSGVGSCTRFRPYDARETDLEEASVVYAYLPERVLGDLTSYLASLPRLRVAISYRHPWPGRPGRKVGDFYLWDLRKELTPVVLRAPRKRVYVVRVWTAPWCGNCKDPKWLKTLERIKRLPNVGIQRLNFDDYQGWCVDNGISSVPSVQIFEGEGKKAKEVGRFTGVISYERLRSRLRD